MNRWTVGGLLLVAVVVVAVLASPPLRGFLSGTSPPTPLPDPVIIVGGPTMELSGGTPVPTMAVQGLPSSVQPLPPGDYGIEVGEGGSIRGTEPGGSVRCENEDLIRVDTSARTYLAGVVASGFACTSLVGQWQQTAPGASVLGLRYIAGSQEVRRGLIIVSDQGVSISFQVDGAWRLP